MSSTRIVRDAASEPAPVDDDAAGPAVASYNLLIAYGFILALGRAGFVMNLGVDPAAGRNWIYSVTGLVFAYAYYLIPHVALSLYPVFANLDLRPALAARTLGASRARAFWDNVVPDDTPSVPTGGCAVVVLAMDTDRKAR